MKQALIFSTDARWPGTLGGSDLPSSAGRIDYRLDIAARGLGQGHIHSVGDKDCLVNLADMRLARTLNVTSELSSDTLLVRASLACALHYRVDEQHDWRFVRPAVTVCAMPRGTRIAVALNGEGAQQSTISVLLRPKSLLERHRLPESLLPQALRAVIDNMPARPQMLLSMPLDSDVTSLLHDLLRSRLQGPLLAMQTAARGVELLALVARAWNDRESEIAGTGGFHPREAELVSAARRILAQHFADPPTLQDLAAQLGTNRNKLNQIFQRSMGVTPQAFCLQRRIERAQALLQEGRLNIAQIAEEVGYQHQSSFTAAFRNSVGTCPREYRGRGAGAAATLMLH